MFKQYRTFYSVLLLILLSTLVVMTMYTFSINTSLNTVRSDIQTNNLNRIRFVINSLDHNVAQLDMLATALETDSKVALLPSLDFMDSYEQVRLILDLGDKINLQSFSEGWNNQVSIYSPIADKWIGSSPTRQAPPTAASEDEWHYRPELQSFVTYRIHQGFTVQVSFPVANVREMLDRARTDNNDPFFYRPDNGVIANLQSVSGLTEALLGALTPSLSQREGTEVVRIDGTSYMVNYLKSDTLDWYMIDYLPLDEALQPIVKTRNYFYAACVALLLGGIGLSLFLYRKVQVPIVTLLKGVRLLKHGDFSFRIKRVSHNEFDYLYENFNDMAAQIEDLIEKVYKEKIVSREAMVKQLQAQINPHFLYNCLFFINNMTRLGNDEAVTAMTQNLAEYFRYSTRLDEPQTTLEKELGVVENYLRIQSLRMERLRYEIHVPDSMKRLPVPKLLLQPLVENGIIHGIEKKQSSGMLRIQGFAEEDQYRLIVEDDGRGMTEGQIQELIERIKQPLDESMGCALWNIRQRMEIYFEATAGMEIKPSDLGGLRVTLRWPRRNQQEE